MEFSRKTVLAVSSEEDAALTGAILSETEGSDAFPLVLREDKDGWTIEYYDNGALAEGDATNLLGMLNSAGISLAQAPALEIVPQEDWVSLTQQGLPPVRAGRFLIHGGHDRSRISSHWAIEIDAGRAFGTAHHGSTQGCLIAIDRFANGGQAKAMLDLGTGSGVLAIAAVKALSYKCHVVALDIDPIAVEVARHNCLRNGVGSNVMLRVSNGVAPMFERARFDLVTANILAAPLISLASGIRASTRLGGLIILGGFFAAQAREVTASYSAKGFAKVGGLTIDDWTTAIMRRIS